MEIRTCVVSVEGISPYSQSSFFVSERKPKETSQEFEERCWRERLHVNKDGNVCIPRMAIKYAVDEACKRLGLQVPGEGKTRYTKFFEAGWMIENDPDLGIRLEDVQPEWLWMSSTGQKGKGGGKRVRRCYPYIAQGWQAEIVCVLLDEKIPATVFEQCFESAGYFVGIGRFRPENQGYYGRFKIDSFDWE